MLPKANRYRCSDRHNNTASILDVLSFLGHYNRPCCRQLIPSADELVQGNKTTIPISRMAPSDEYSQVSRLLLDRELPIQTVPGLFVGEGGVDPGRLLPSRGVSVLQINHVCQDTVRVMMMDNRGFCVLLV